MEDRIYWCPWHPEKGWFTCRQPVMSDTAEEAHSRLVAYSAAMAIYTPIEEVEQRLAKEGWVAKPVRLVMAGADSF